MCCTTAPVETGIDKPIGRLQRHLYKMLCKQWKMDEGEYEAFGRCYRNYRDGAYIPELYIGGKSGKDYRPDILPNDKLKALSFFGISGETITINNSRNSANAHLIFFVNLDKLFTGKEGRRPDEYIRNDVQNILNERTAGIEPVTITLGVQNVFQEYPGARSLDSIRKMDLHPWHCFRFNLLVTYDISYNQIKMQ